jgi:hypothetical protein
MASGDATNRRRDGGHIIHRGRDVIQISKLPTSSCRVVTGSGRNRPETPKLVVPWACQGRWAAMVAIGGADQGFARRMKRVCA